MMRRCFLLVFALLVLTTRPVRASEQGFCTLDVKLTKAPTSIGHKKALLIVSVYAAHVLNTTNPHFTCDHYVGKTIKLYWPQKAAADFSAGTYLSIYQDHSGLGYPAGTHGWALVPTTAD